MIVALLAGLAGAGPVRAQAYGSDAQAALAGAAPRLQWFALQSDPAPGAVALQRYLGLAHAPGMGPAYVAHELGLAPVLEFDSNINGGTPGGYVQIGGLKFTLTEASKAKAGVVLGMAASASLRLSLAPGRVIEGSASGQIARAPQHDLTRRSYALRLCGAQHLGRSDWLDLCIGRRGTQRALASGDETHAAVGFARQYANRHGLHEASLRLERVDNGHYAKTSLDFGATHASARLGVVEWRVEWGEYIPGQHTRLGGVALSLTRPLWGAQTTLFVAGAQEGGGAFFGTARTDQVFRLGLTRALHPRLALTLSAEDRRSSLENYTGVTMGFALTIALPPLSGG